jgi:NAD(P)-dependent dehydrogenase (short-subunit alcohol dehydrogenase family)
MKQRLEGKVAIVTGAGTGIGEAIAKKFAREGARVVVNGLPDDPVRDVVASIQREGFEATPYAGDVADEQHARACVDVAIRTYGKLDVLVNNAGVFLVNAETDDIPIESFDQQQRANTRSAFLMTKYALARRRATTGWRRTRLTAEPRRGCTRSCRA